MVLSHGTLQCRIHVFSTEFACEPWPGMVPMYLVNPLQGSMLGFVFYLLVRGGVMAVSENIGAASEVGLAGISALVGMFSDQAAEKLKAIAEAIFSSPKTEGWKDRGPGEAGK